MSYSQFIHGKTSGGRTYQPVAHTPDLADRRDELETIARRYRFWGSQPPVDKPIAVGIFRYRDTLLLAQAMQAMRGNGRPAADAQGRPFTQHRYVFIPPGSLGDLRGRWWLLLNWVMEETGGIPTFTRPEPALAPLAAPRFDAPRDPAAGSLDRLARSLRLADAQGRPVLLSALAALVNRKRVIFDAAATHDVFSEDLLEGMLLLLPAVCREQVAVAAGALDETICTRADLMVKTNGPPAGPLSPDLIWARRANNRFLGAAGPTTPANEYTDLLRPIVARPESHPMLVQILDGIDSLAGSGHSTPWPLLNNGWLATRLIPALPDPKIRAEYWQSALSRLSPDEWQATLPAILDETGLEIAWAELQQQIKRRPETFAPLVFQLWQNFSRAYIRYALQEELPADLTLAEILLRYGLAGQLGPEHRADLFALSLAVIEALGGQNRRRAAELADFILQRGPFNVPAEQFALHNAALSGNPGRAALVEQFNTRLAPLLPALTPAELSSSNLYRGLQARAPRLAALLKTVVARQAQEINLLPELADAAGMSLADRRALVAAALHAWQPPYRTARPLLADLATRWIADFPPDERPSLSAPFEGLADWLAAHAPRPAASLLAASGAEFTVADWLVVAEALFEDSLAQASFLDHATGGQPAEALLQHWLAAVAADEAAKAHFEASYTWHTLQSGGPTWLAQAVARLLGWEPVSLSALLPLLERLQNTLTLSRQTLFQLLKTVPRPGDDDDLGVMLTACLPQTAADTAAPPDELPPWQMLNAQAPKVAHIYKILAEGQKNPALDKFNQLKLNGALNEAPEYAPSLARWLHLCGKGSWVSGRLLETLVDQWLAQPKAIDPALLAGLLQPGLVEKYTVSDWLALAQLCWLPDYQSLWPLSGQPALNTRRRLQVLDVAKTRLAQYTTPAQAHRLATACRNWGLSADELAELVAAAPAPACNFSLLHPYLYNDGTAIAPGSHVSQTLILQALQLAPADPAEQAQLRLFVTQIVKQQLQHAADVATLIAWADRAANSKVWQNALTAAAADLAPEQFSLLVGRAHRLKRQGAANLCRALVAALDAYWAGQKQTLK